MLIVWMRRWLLFTLGLPVLAWALESAGEALERRNGPSDLTRGLQGFAGKLRSWRGRRGRRGRRR